MSMKSSDQSVCRALPDWRRGEGGTKAELSLNDSGHLQRGLSKRRNQVRSCRVTWTNQSVNADDLYAVKILPPSFLQSYCGGAVTLSLLSEGRTRRVPVT